jgi:hypothetical protein
MDEIVRSRTLNFPLGVSQPADIMEFIQRAGYEWDISGHPGLPDTKFEFQQTSSNYVKPDQDLQDRLRKASIMGMSLSPETVDNGFNTEFATTAVANNILLAKRVIVTQDIFCPQLTDHMRKVAVNTESVVVAVKDILEKNFKNINLKVDDIEGLKESGEQLDEEAKKRIIISHSMHAFLNGFTVELPRPSSVTMESQLTELKAYSDMLDAALDAYLTADIFTKTTAGTVAEAGTTVRSLYKGYFMRKWMAEKNIMPELTELMNNDTDVHLDNTIVKDITTHLQAITRMAVKSLVDLSANASAADKDLVKAGIDTSGSPSFDSGGGFGGGGGSSFGGSGDDGLGGFDLGSGDGLGDLNLDTGTGTGEDTAAGGQGEDTAAGGEDTAQGGEDTAAGGEQTPL